ncbi:hypothetical protein SAMN00777080_0303 [Aquiflexum balticum DSM 16537]|jgi:hypothetical protein|uniref:Uncharacterized protein n=1 Tax=Aquiflexum balticum DSM 16537 TaxID=758820 RepID=A0A1W2GZE0_9BACT|nr:hypothetical protein [Aquiflexum balticum]SMD41772.1 hypothetical protein SAMN00777080_0303 [Aquiflexum balticum DSM 16537]
MVSNIVSKLQTTSKLKYNLFESTEKLFGELEIICRELMQEIIETNKEEKPIPLKIEKINDYEFIFRIGGDVLIFILQSNIVRLPDDTYLSKSKYLKKDVSLRYFGQILIYNFLSDTLTFGRLEDPGYLIGRILLNRENKFFLEGDRKIVFNFPELKDNPVSKEKMRDLVEQLVVSVLENDLLAPAFQDIMLISYHQKLEHTSSMGNPQKIGFDLFAKNRE